MPQFNTIAHKIFKCLCIWQLCLTGQNVKKKRYFEHDVKIVSKHILYKKKRKKKETKYVSIYGSRLLHSSAKQKHFDYYQ